MLTRRSFVQTVGIGGAAAYIGARGRENAIWSAETSPLTSASHSFSPVVSLRS